MVLLPSELYMQVASCLEPPDLKSYSLVSKQVRTCALEYMLFDTHDKETMQRAVGAGARKLKLTWNDGVVDVEEPLRIVELIFNKRVDIAVDPSVFKNLTILNINSCMLTEVHTLPSTLVTLDCWNNRLTLLPDLPSTLAKLNCSFNPSSTLLARFPTPPSSLVELYYYNPL
jgi:hypothetical protein